MSLMKPGKSPELDGFPSEYYKNFIDKLVPIRTEVYEESFSLGELSITYNKALISLIGKKDPTRIYRPVSLINVDCQILTKILAMRLETTPPRIIHADQVGFIKGRSSTDNIRCLLHLIQVNQEQKRNVS